MVPSTISTLVSACNHLGDLRVVSLRAFRLRHMPGMPNPLVDAESTRAEIPKNLRIDGSALHAGQHDEHEKKETLYETL